MIDATEFVELIFGDDNTNECKKTFTGLATVSAVDGNKVEIVVDGERDASGKLRNYLSSYNPKRDDRVIVFRDIVLGSIKK